MPSFNKIHEPSCHRNLSEIGDALKQYAAAHSGRYPDSLEQLVLAGADLDKRVYVCPSSNDEPPTATDREAIAASFSQEGHFSYVYLATGLTLSASADSPLVTEPLTNHYGEANILFADGHVERCTKDKAKRILGDKLVEHR